MGMLKLNIVAAFVLVAFVLPQQALAWTCTPGQYEGKTWSVTKALGGHAATLAVSNRGEMCVLRFKCPAAGLDELWELTGRHLKQTEFNAKGKRVKGYGATLEVRKGVEGYYIDCPGGACEDGIDGRYFWRVRTSGKRIIYSVWGVAPEKQSDPKAKAKKRHEYTFQ